MKNKSAFFVILAGMLWGIISLFIKPLSVMGFSAMQITMLRSILSFLMFFAYLIATDISKLKIAFKDIWLFIGTGVISLFLFNVCYFYAIINGQASIAVVLLYTSPIFIMLFSALLFKEKINFVKILALVLTLCGCISVSGMLSGKLNISRTVLMFGIASGLFYGMYTIFGKFALKKYSSQTVTAYTFLFALIGILPLCNIKQTAISMAQQPKSILLFLGSALFCTVLPYFLYTKGLEKLESGKAAIIVAIEPLVGAVVGTIFFQEPLNATKIMGIILILSAIFILNFDFKKLIKKSG